MRVAPWCGAILSLTLATACDNKPAAPTAAGVDTAGIRTALTAQVAKAVAAFSAKDTSGVAAVFTDDATWIEQDGSTYKGKAAIIAQSKNIFGQVESFTVTSSTLDALLSVNDHEAVTASTWNFTLKVKGKKDELHHNPFMDYWQKGADGTWRIAYEINADGVVTEPNAAAKKS